MTGTPTSFTNHPNVTQIPTTHQPASADPDAINATQALINRLEAHHTPPGPTQDPNWYSWIPLPHDTFLQGLLQARQILNRYGTPPPSGRYTFLDVGSGIGTKLIIAHELGYHPTGIERWQPYIEVSRKIAPFAPVIHANANDIAVAVGLRQFDLIHYYGCAPDPDRDGHIKQRITNAMKPGSILFTTRKPYPDHLERVAPFLWRKTSS
jgi:SAM-dependent methyltransferase